MYFLRRRLGLTTMHAKSRRYVPILLYGFPVHRSCRLIVIAFSTRFSDSFFFFIDQWHLKLNWVTSKTNTSMGLPMRLSPKRKLLLQRRESTLLSCNKTRNPLSLIKMRMMKTLKSVQTVAVFFYLHTSSHLFDSVTDVHSFLMISLAYVFRLILLIYDCFIDTKISCMYSRFSPLFTLSAFLLSCSSPL